MKKLLFQFKIALILIIIIFSINEVNAIGLAAYSHRVLLDFKPNLEQTFNYKLLTNADKIMDYNLTAEGGMGKYFQLDPPILRDIPPGAAVDFRAIMMLPDAMPSGGHEVLICVADTQA